MRRWKLLLVLAGLSVLAVGAFALWPKPITPGLTQENFDRVEVGMTLPEVKALLGEPYMQDTNGIQPFGPRHPDWAFGAGATKPNTP
jgi:outer membrane protein assembly factor BamE (lipoprotein component of BamABCDE complex)